MARDRKADLRGVGLNEKHLTGTSKRFLFSDYRHFPHAVQCLFCGSDYMKFATEGYCQGCQQRAEYVVREHPKTATRALNVGRNR